MSYTEMYYDRYPTQKGYRSQNDTSWFGLVYCETLPYGFIFTRVTLTYKQKNKNCYLDHAERVWIVSTQNARILIQSKMR